MISAENTMAVCAVIFALAWFGFWMDTLAIGRKISGVVCVLIGAMLLSNLGLIPFKSLAYDFVGSNLVPLAIPLLLFKSDLKKIFRESGRVMLVFFIAGAATALSAIIGFYLFDLGGIGPKVAGVYTGGFIGGAVNFLAVSQVVQMNETEFSTAISASSIVSILALTLLLAIPSMNFIQRFFQDKSTPATGQVVNTEHPTAKLKLSHLSGAIALSFGICALAKYLSKLIGYEQCTFLVITVITLLVANLFPKQLHRVEGEYECGLLLMYLFFSVVGAGTDMSVFIGTAVILFFYGMFIVTFHLCVVLFVSRKLGFRLDETVVASGAALVGPAVTAAIATSKNWRHLVTPGIMCGIFGYAIATFIGVAVSHLLV